MIDTLKYYLYHLIDSCNGVVFYVGKGTGNRMYIHVKDVLKGKVPNDGNSHLGRKIKKILNAGLVVEYKKVFFTDDEEEVKGLTLIKESV